MFRDANTAFSTKAKIAKSGNDTSKSKENESNATNPTNEKDQQVATATPSPNRRHPSVESMSNESTKRPCIDQTQKILYTPTRGWAQF